MTEPQKSSIDIEVIWVCIFSACTGALWAVQWPHDNDPFGVALGVVATACVVLLVFLKASK